MNISFELTREERGHNRTIQKLALLLAHLLPIPLIVIAENRRSTGIGVRPRRERVEVTLDFTPDPALMAATAALVVGIVREVISWPSYRAAEIDDRGIPRIEGITPGKHATRKGWLTRDFHFPRNPFKTDLDAPVWKTAGGDKASLREVALGVATQFKDSIRRYGDPFAYRLLFSILRGETPALLDLPDRPPAYDDVGRAIKWGTLLPELKNFARPLSGGPSRSIYERLFLKLGRMRPLHIDGETLTPVKVQGWYHSIFRTADGKERMLSIDQLRTLDY
jgi:hypothetical protein